MLQFRDVDEEQRVRDVAAYGTLPLQLGVVLCQICILRRGGGPPSGN